MQSPDLDPCEICLTEIAQTFQTQGDYVHQKCPRCGEFQIAGTAAHLLRVGQGSKKRALLSGWVKHQNELGGLPSITSEIFNVVTSSSPPPVWDRAISLLKEAEKTVETLDGHFDVNQPGFLSASTSENINEVQYLAGALEQEGLVTRRTSNGVFLISPKGYRKLDEVRNASVASIKGFVAMYFSNDLNDAYNLGLKAGIELAGYEAVRVDKVEHVNKIDDEIISQINGSKFVIADFTGHRGGVYFEAGYALGKKIPVFWTCRKDHMKELHFDIRQFNCIGWETADELKGRLSKRIEAVLGLGPNVK